MKKLKDLFTRKKREPDKINNEEPFSIPSAKSFSGPSEAVNLPDETTIVNPVSSGSEMSAREADNLDSKGSVDSGNIVSDGSGVKVSNSENSKREHTESNNRAVNGNNGNDKSLVADGKSVSGERSGASSESGNNEPLNIGGGLAATSESIVLGAAAIIFGNRGSDIDEDSAVAGKGDSGSAVETGRAGSGGIGSHVQGSTSDTKGNSEAGVGESGVGTGTGGSGNNGHSGTSGTVGNSESGNAEAGSGGTGSGINGHGGGSGTIINTRSGVGAPGAGGSGSAIPGSASGAIGNSSSVLGAAVVGGIASIVPGTASGAIGSSGLVVESGGAGDNGNLDTSGNTVSVEASGANGNNGSVVGAGAVGGESLDTNSTSGSGVGSEGNETLDVNGNSGSGAGSGGIRTLDTNNNSGSGVGTGGVGGSGSGVGSGGAGGSGSLDTSGSGGSSSGGGMSGSGGSGVGGAGSGAGGSGTGAGGSGTLDTNSNSGSGVGSGRAGGSGTLGTNDNSGSGVGTGGAGGSGAGVGSGTGSSGSGGLGGNSNLAAGVGGGIAAGVVGGAIIGAAAVSASGNKAGGSAGNNSGSGTGGSSGSTAGSSGSGGATGSGSGSSGTGSGSGSGGSSGSAAGGSSSGAATGSGSGNNAGGSSASSSGSGSGGSSGSAAGGSSSGAATKSGSSSNAGGSSGSGSGSGSGGSSGSTAGSNSSDVATGSGSGNNAGGSSGSNSGSGTSGSSSSSSGSGATTGSGGGSGNSWNYSGGAKSDTIESDNSEADLASSGDAGSNGKSGSAWNFASPNKSGGSGSDGGSTSPISMGKGRGAETREKGVAASTQDTTAKAKLEEEETPLSSAAKSTEPATPEREMETESADASPKASPSQDAGSSRASCASGHDHGPANKEEEEEIEYELYVQLEEAVSQKKLNGKPVFFREKDKKWKVAQTDGEGCINIGFYEEQKDIEIQLLQDRFKGYELKESYSFKTQQEKQPPQKLILECVLLEIVQCDPHFVPTGKADDENLEIKFNINKLKDADVFLCIYSEFHSPNLLYEYQLKPEEKSDGNNKILKWDGKTNCTEGNLKDKLITPLLGPYKIILEARTHDFFSEPKETNVLYHSVKLKKGSYLEDPSTPPAKQGRYPSRTDDPNYRDHLMWVQFRLNELGYFSGPVNGNLTDQTKRAIKRYTYEMFNHPETDNPLDEYFLNSLAGDDNKVILFEHDDVIENKGKKSKVYIQHNYFYDTSGPKGVTIYNLPDTHFVKEEEKLDRFECPLEAEVRLRSRKDATGTGDGVLAPEVLLGTKIKWTVADPPEDTSMLPPYIYRKSPTVSKSYIEQLTKRVKAKYNGRDNCPPECGGVKDSDDYFSPLMDILPVTPGANNTIATTKFYSSDVNHKQYGKTGVIFKGSHIGGDNFIIKAEINFDNLPNRDKLIAANQSDAIIAESGELTVWRKRRVTDVVDWMPQKGAAVQWDETVKCFKEAFIEMDVTTFYDHRMMSEIIGDGNKRDAEPYLKSILYWMENLPSVKKVLKDTDVSYSSEHLWPFTLDPQTKEEIDLFHFFYTTIDKSDLLKRVTLGCADAVQHPSFGDLFRQIIGKRKRPGIIIVRFIAFKGINKKVGHQNLDLKLDMLPGSVSTGTGNGGVVLNKKHRDQLKDGFLVTHEIAHCYFITHPTDRDDSRNQRHDLDHDLKDKNCLMYYLHMNNYIPDQPSTIATPERGEDRTAYDASQRALTAYQESVKKRLQQNGDWEGKFCARCLLKLRGWKVNINGKKQEDTVLIVDHVVPIIPVNARMEFVKYQIVEGSYKGLVKGVEKDVLLTIGSKDPANKKIPLGPLQFLHVHKLSFDASYKGSLSELKGVATRELVEYDKPTQGPPFTVAADPDQFFAQNGSDAGGGGEYDDHSVMIPSLICMNPGVPGKITAVQRYQYTRQPYPNQGTFQDIPEAVFILEKEVYLHPSGIYVLSFKKYNKSDENPNHFFFEVHYKIGPPPVTKPIVVSNPSSKHVKGKYEGKSYYVDQKAFYFKSGANKVEFSKKREKPKKDGSIPAVIPARDVTLNDLKKWGYLAPEPWPPDPHK